MMLEFSLVEGFTTQTFVAEVKYEKIVGDHFRFQIQ